jgi:hypothetical protein
VQVETPRPRINQPEGYGKVWGEDLDSFQKQANPLTPIYHDSDERVQAHVFVAALALLLERALEKKLRAAGSPLSSPFAWQALETIRCVELQLGSRRKLCVTRGNEDAQLVLRILGITQLDPPTPEEGQESLM